MKSERNLLIIFDVKSTMSIFNGGCSLPGFDLPGTSGTLGTVAAIHLSIAKVSQGDH